MPFGGPFGGFIFGGSFLGNALISGLGVYGVIESGLGGISPIFNPFIYLSKTLNYQVPTYTYNAPKPSAKDEKSSVKIIENQLVGISRAHSYFQNYVTFQGYFSEQSNFSGNPPIALNVQVSGIEAYINRIYVGSKPETKAWSGLSSTGTNFLWLSLVEQNQGNIGFLSSRQFADYECRATSSIVPPIGPEDSVLVGTYTSGTGLNLSPIQKNPFTLVGDHVADNDKPHGNPLGVSYITCSGLEILRRSNWNYSACSGAPSGIPFNDVQYLNDLTVTQNTSIIVSGILGNVQSGIGGFFTNPYTGWTNPTVTGGSLAALNAILGNLTVVSGLAVSGSTFRNPIVLNSGLTTDGLQIGTLKALTVNQELRNTSFAALTFSGNYISIPVPTRTSMTLEAWIKTSDNLGDPTWPWWDGKGIIDGEMPGFTTDFGMSLTGGNVAFGIGNSDTTIHSSIVADGNWHHCAGTWDSSTGAMILYIDGVKVSNTTGPTGSRSAVTGLKIGAQNQLSVDPNGVPQYFIGSIDDVRVWSTVRTQAQIIGAKNAPLVAPQAGLAAYWRFDDASGVTTYLDDTTRYNGTVVAGGTRGSYVGPTRLLGGAFGNAAYEEDVYPTTPMLHGHGMNDLPYTSIMLSPKYPGMTTLPIYSGTALSNRFILGQDFGNSTLRHVSSANSNVDYMYIRGYVPPYFNKLESINIQNYVDSGNGVVQVRVRDALGQLQNPVQGNVLYSGQGLNISYVSGISQTGFGQNSPFDIEFTFNSISGLSHYLGDIVVSFLAQTP